MRKTSGPLGWVALELGGLLLLLVLLGGMWEAGWFGLLAWLGQQPMEGSVSWKLLEKTVPVVLTCLTLGLVLRILGLVLALLRGRRQRSPRSD